MCWVIPSGYSTMFWSSPAGLASRPGAVRAIRATVVRIEAATNRPATRMPSLAANIAASTASAGQAVAFIAQAKPMASPANSGSRSDPVLRNLAAQARAKHIRAMTGGSVMPTASGSASTGEATANTAHHAATLRQAPQREERCGATIQNAAASSTAEVGGQP